MSTNQPNIQSKAKRIYRQRKWAKRSKAQQENTLPSNSTALAIPVNKLSKVTIRPSSYYKPKSTPTLILTPEEEAKFKSYNFKTWIGRKVKSAKTPFTKLKPSLYSQLMKSSRGGTRIPLYYYSWKDYVTKKTIRNPRTGNPILKGGFGSIRRGKLLKPLGWRLRAAKKKKVIKGITKMKYRLQYLIKAMRPKFRGDVSRGSRKLSTLNKYRISMVKAGQRSLGKTKRFQLFNYKRFILKHHSPYLHMTYKIRIRNLFESQLNRLLYRLRFFPSVNIATHMCERYGVFLIGNEFNSKYFRNPYAYTGIGEWVSLSRHFKRLFAKRYKVLYAIKRYKYLIQPTLERYYVYDYHFLVGCQIKLFDADYLISQRSLRMKGIAEGLNWKSKIKRQGPLYHKTITPILYKIREFFPRVATKFLPLKK